MPFPDRILHLSELFEKFFIAGVIGQLQNVAQFFDFEAIWMKICFVEVNGTAPRYSTS